MPIQKLLRITEDGELIEDICFDYSKGTSFIQELRKDLTEKDRKFFTKKIKEKLNSEGSLNSSQS